MTNVRRQDIESMEPGKVSMMPEGLLTRCKRPIQDLVAYLLREVIPQQYVPLILRYPELLAHSSGSHPGCRLEFGPIGLESRDVGRRSAARLPVRIPREIDNSPAVHCRIK